jgi:tetratricopeptide (TPR) repeat protein
VLPERARPYLDLAELYAFGRNVEGSRALLAQFAQIKDTAFARSRSSRVRWIQALIALDEKRPREAIAEARKSLIAADGLRAPNPPRTRFQFVLGAAFDMANEPDSAIVAYQDYLNSLADDRLVDDVYLRAGAQRRIGELYEARGDNTKAIDALSKFVELWKNADPELQPFVADARKRIARISAQEKR